MPLIGIRIRPSQKDSRQLVRSESVWIADCLIVTGLEQQAPVHETPQVDVTGAGVAPRAVHCPNLILFDLPRIEFGRSTFLPC